MLAARHLQALGWEVLASQVAVGRDEIDIVAVEPARPGPAAAHGEAPAPATLVFVEVRSHTTSRFGLPEESVDRRKVARLYRAALTLRRVGRLRDRTVLPRLPWRIDVLAVDVRPSLGAGLGGPAIRHIRGVTPE